jgi:hypothetical protein
MARRPISLHHAYAFDRFKIERRFQERIAALFLRLVLSFNRRKNTDLTGAVKPFRTFSVIFFACEKWASCSERAATEKNGVNH